MSDVVAVDPPHWLPQLRRDERLLWRGRPSQRIIALRPSDLVVVPILSFWLLVAGGLLVGVADWVNAVLGYLAVALVAGLWIQLLAGRFAVNWMRRRHTAYALTSQRAFIRTGVRKPRTHTLRHHAGLAITYSIRGNGSGSIVFWEDRATSLTDMGLDGFQFYRIPDAAHVRTLLARSHGEPGRVAPGPPPPPGPPQGHGPYRPWTLMRSPVSGIGRLRQRLADRPRTAPATSGVPFVWNGG